MLQPCVLRLNRVESTECGGLSFIEDLELEVIEGVRNCVFLCISTTYC